MDNKQSILEYLHYHPQSSRNDIQKNLSLTAVEFFGEFDPDVVGEELADIRFLRGHLNFFLSV